MRKIIVAICGIILAGGAIGAENRTYEHPNVVADRIQNAWGWSSSFAYPTKVSEKISPASFYNDKNGTYGYGSSDDEGSIIPVIAREIYEHGGLFGMTQMQAAWTNRLGTGQPRWIDFFDQDEYKRQVVCESGWSGTKCEKHEYDCSDLSIDYKTELNNPLDGKYRILSGEQDGRITSEIDVFDYLDGYYGSSNNLPDGNFSDSKTDEHYSVVLAVIEIKPHALIVGPTKVSANKNTITKAFSKKDSYKVLCAPGYTENSTHDDCVMAPECAESITNQNWCPSWNDSKYDETQHKLVSVGGCKQFRCKNENYGFETWTNKKCVPCGSGKSLEKKGIGVNGACLDCDGENEFYYKKEQRCVRMQKITKDKMRACFMKTDPDEFKTCVMGE